MTTRSETDSRDYRFAFAVCSAADVPADFREFVTSPFESAVFLPGAEPDWFGRSAYSPALLMIFNGAVSIIRHRTSKQLPIAIPLPELHCIESGHILLQSWLKFEYSGGDVTFEYNSTFRHPVRAFIAALGRTYLQERRISDDCRFEVGVLDYKMQNALADVLEPAEHISHRISRPAREVPYRIAFWKRRNWHASDVLVLTDRRLLWITDRYKRQFVRYGAVTRYTPAQMLKHASVTQHSSDDPELRLRFSSGRVWRVPLASDQINGAEEFARQLLYS